MPITILHGNKYASGTSIPGAALQKIPNLRILSYLSSSRGNGTLGSYLGKGYYRTAVPNSVVLSYLKLRKVYYRSILTSRNS